MLNAAEAVAMIYPPAQEFIAGLHAAINLFKFGCKQYYSYQDDKERKSSERIGDINVEKLKIDKIEEKSGRVGFKDAIIILSRINDLEEKETQSPPNITKEEKSELSIKKSVLKTNIVNMNNNQTSDSPITQDNLNSFLELEQEAINNIAAEVKKDEARILKFSRLFHIPEKEGIIKKMKADGIFQANGDIELKDSHKLDPAHQDYFFEKTQIAIRTASDRKHISSNERLDMMEKMLLTKVDDVVIRNYMIKKYEGKKVYEEHEKKEDKFTKSVTKFKLEMKLD
jgi:hypothetical protein